MTEARGIVFGAKGDTYNILSRRAALTLRETMPGTPIDLFTDQPGYHARRPEAFDKVHALDLPWFRPKMEALQRSRFARTIYLDCDVIVLTDIGDVFDVLDHADLALAHEATRLSDSALTPSPFGGPLPNAVAGFNSGVIAAKASEPVHALLGEWQRLMRETHAPRDQPILRHLLHGSALRVHVLTNDYNDMYPHSYVHRPENMTAPRVIHTPQLYRQKRFLNRPDAPFDVQSLLGFDNARALHEMIARDVTYPGAPRLPIWSGPRSSVTQALLDWLPHRLRRHLIARIDRNTLDR